MVVDVDLVVFLLIQVAALQLLNGPLPVARALCDLDDTTCLTLASQNNAALWEFSTSSFTNTDWGAVGQGGALSGDGTVLFVPVYPATVVCLNTTNNGSVVWSFTFPTDQYDYYTYNSMPDVATRKTTLVLSLDETVLYVPAFSQAFRNPQSAVLALDAKDGTTKWTCNLDVVWQVVTGAVLSLDGSALFVASGITSSNTYNLPYTSVSAIDTSNGEMLWTKTRADLPWGQDIITTSITWADNGLVLSADGTEVYGPDRHHPRIHLLAPEPLSPCRARCI